MSDGLHRRWVKTDTGAMKQVAQPDAQVKAIVDFSHACRTGGSAGGTGTDNMKYMANLPMALYGQWLHDWRMKGGLNGTGMKSHEYCVLQMSLPDYQAFVSTPSGKTGFERQARKLTFGYENYGRGVKLQKLAPTPKQVITEAK